MAGAPGSNLERLRDQGLYKRERVIASLDGTVARLDRICALAGRELGVPARP